MLFPSREIVERVRKEYPVGTRVILLRMDDPQAPPIGTFGTVEGVDDAASVMVHWDNGSRLHVVYGVDLCRRLLPDEKPGTTLTLIVKNGECKAVGPIPKIDPANIPDYVKRCAARLILDGARRAMADPEYRAKYEAWLKTRETAQPKPSPKDKKAP